MNNFISKNLKISDARIERSVELGGTGFFNLKKFLIAQQCTWINRALKLQIDNWRYDLRNSSPDGNILNIRKGDIEKKNHPILWGIVNAYETFLEEFSKLDGNFKNVPVFMNNAFPINNSKSAFLDPGFFGENFYRQNKTIIRKLTYADCHVENRIKTLAEFRNDNFPLTPAIWFKLCGAVSCWRRVFGGGGPCINTTLPNFFNSIKKG
jgi:hypothetical protein